MTATQQSFSILIAEDNDVTRELMTSILKTHGFNVVGVSDGEQAMRMVEAYGIDMAFVDINMDPVGGFDFIKYLIVKGNKLPTVIVTADKSADILIEANALGVKRVLQKPIVPERLLDTAHRILRQAGHNLSPLGTESRKIRFTPDELMEKAIALAALNAEGKKGGPFGAVIADKDGKIIGEGVSGALNRADPIAHAEVMAIRKAAEVLGTGDLSECVLYCSSLPTAMGQALIKSVGIQNVYYGLSHDEISKFRAKAKPAETRYHQLGHDSALEMFKTYGA